MSDYGDEQEEGPVQKMFNSCAGMVLGCILFPLALFLLFSNEKSFVCSSEALQWAKGEVKQEVTDCNAEASQQGVFTYLSCPITWDPDESNGYTWDLEPETNKGFVPPTMKVTRRAEIYSCVKEERKDKNGKVTQTSYPASWGSSLQEYTGSGVPKECEVKQNANLVNVFNAQKGKVEASKSSVPAGKWVISNNVQLVAGNMVPTQFNTKAPVGYNAEGNVLYAGGCSSAGPAAGCIRFTYTSSIADHISAMAQMVQSELPKYKYSLAPKTWGGGLLCGAESWGKARGATKSSSKVEFVANLQGELDMILVVMRFVGLFLAWFGVYMIFQPIAAAAEVIGDFLNMIPCVGSFMKNLVEGVVTAVLCLMSCSIGCACGLLVISVTWLVMRPWPYGILSFIGFLVLCVGGVGARKAAGDSVVKKKSARQPMFGAQMASMQPGAGGNMFQVVCPDNIQGGEMVQTQAPNGQMVQVMVPVGVWPGQVFTAQY